MFSSLWDNISTPDDTNVECVDCKNCLWCVGCKNCVNCQSTDHPFEKEFYDMLEYINCKYCEGCDDCNECDECYDCITCDGCESCDKCQNCVDCIDCDNCQDCVDCTDCVNCINCVNCKGLNGYSNTKNLTINNKTTEERNIKRLLYKEEKEEEMFELLKKIDESYYNFLLEDLWETKCCRGRCCGPKRCDIQYRESWFGEAIQDNFDKPYKLKINKNIKKLQAKQMINEVMNYNDPVDYHFLF